MSVKILGVSGHRALYSFPNSRRTVVRSKAKSVLLNLNPTSVITGLAIGWDTLIANLCIELDIPFIAAVPFKGQEAYWSATDQKHYNDLLMQAKDVVIVSPGGMSGWKYQVRNKYIVDNSDMMLFFYSGAPSGTKNCFDYAEKQGKRYVRINPLDFKQ